MARIKKSNLNDEWIPFRMEEENPGGDGWIRFLCELPKDGQEILVSRGNRVFIDEWDARENYGFLSSGYDIEEGMAWMPLPDPY